MRLRYIGRALFIVLVVVTATACGERSVNSLLTPSSTVASSNSPAAGPIAISGRIRESAPTQIVGVLGATLRIIDGENAGRSAMTDILGSYQFTGLQPGHFTVIVSAPGFIDGSETVSVDADTAVNLYLRPVPHIVNHTSTGAIAANDGTCSDGVSLKPCRIFGVAVHNDGPVTATLTWTGGSAADLDLTLFQTGRPLPIERSNRSGPGPERITADVPGGAMYELRMTWAAGSGSAQYVLEVSYPY